MTSSSSRRSNAPVLPFSAPLHRTSPSSAIRGAASPFASYSSSSAASPFAYPSTSNTFLPHERSASPTRVYLTGSSPPPRAPSVRFTLDRSTSPGRSAASASSPVASAQPRRTCMCSPSTHAGSFRCSLHKDLRFPPYRQAATSSPSYRLVAGRLAMTNALVRIGAVEGDLVKRALAALIRPSSHHQRRRADFRPRASRLSVMSKADDP
ncbi:hypothetical protein Cni_G24268 [Canna indica]|uniref:Serine-rich protein-like protein n=1 Tax=Canna indica TaxID=4628 RepID=A0AAQ3KXQ0_9LILI|nr:hypothetical protein Cni_G24268 [Canna indica]